MKIALIIFTRNERKNSEKIFSKIPFKKVDAVYVIDGNSTDGTKEFWKKKGIKVFSQKYKGVGGAYESAFRNTKEDALIFFHPDGNMDPHAISEFIKRLKKGEEFIIASRVIKGAKNEEDDQLFKYRKWSSGFMAFVINALWSNSNNRATDLTQGYRALTRRVYSKLGIKVPDAIAPDTEQIIRALKNGVQITEFATTEGKRVYGETTMPSFKTSVENIKVFVRELVKDQAVYNKILLVFLIIWTAFAVVSVAYNAVKTISEVKEWAFLSDNEKRYKIFDNLHDYFVFIQNNTNPNGSILLYSEDARAFYLSKYYLYPRKVDLADNVQDLKKMADSGEYMYLAVSEDKVVPQVYQMAASGSSKKNLEFFLYKKYE